MGQFQQLGVQSDCRSAAALCGLAGHQCGPGDSTAAGAVGDRPRHEEWGAVPAGIAARGYLLERWQPADPAGRPRWRIRATTGRARRVGRTWPPTEDELLDTGLFPVRLSDDVADAGGSRRPAAVVPLLADDAVPIADILAPGGAADERIALLTKNLIGALTNHGGSDLARVELTGAPDDLCLVRADHEGNLLALTITPTETSAETPAGEPGCLLAGHRCPKDTAVEASEMERRKLLVRGVCAARVLSSALYVNNNSYISYEFDVTAVPGLDLPRDLDAADAALRTWWRTRPEISRDLQREEFDDEEDGGPVEDALFWPLAERIDRARALRLIRDWEEDLSAGLARTLFRDMIDSACAYLCPDGAEPLAYTAGWALREETGSGPVVPGAGWGDEEGASALFLAGRRGVVRVERVFIV